MSSTTQILFNSPALHSLKREQLLKLCKIHSIKATGKNTELIERLKQHSLTLPRDSPLSIAARSEETCLPPHTTERLFDDPPYERLRPSEQWEVVMDSIEEADETTSAQGTLTSLRTVGKDKSAGEFGTAGSKSSVSSSLKAFATSLGLKRSGITSSKPTSSMKSHPETVETAEGIPEADDMEGHSRLNSHPPPATSATQFDVFASQVHEGGAGDVGMEEPVPGHVLRPGVPAPPNARLSLGLGLTAPHTPSKQAQPTTTIRLVRDASKPSPSTPQLAPFKTEFDLIISPRMTSGLGFGTFSSGTTWSSESIYPTLPLDMDAPFTQPLPNDVKAIGDADGDVTMPGAFSSPHPSDLPSNIATESTMVPVSAISPVSGDLKPLTEPFIFGSPLPKHRVSDAQFREAAVGVLEEMNKRLQAEGVGVVDTAIVKRLHPGALATTLQVVEQNPTINEHRVKDMFDKKHQVEFEKMEGIDAFIKRKAAKHVGDDDRIVVGKKRKSSVLADESRNVPSQVASRASGTRVISNGRRKKMIPGAFDDGEFDLEAEADENRGQKRAKRESGGADVHDADLQERRERDKERELIRKKLEANKARRKSSAAAARLSGRVSLGRVQQKQKPSRFGFLLQAKSLVQNMFGRGKPAKAGTSSVTAPTASSKAKAERQEPDQNTKKLSVASASRNLASRPTDSITRSTSSKTSLGTRVSNTLDKEQRYSSVARSRSPIPSFSGSATSSAMVARAKKSEHSRNNSVSSLSDMASSALRQKATEAKIPSTSSRRSVVSTSSAAGSLGAKKTTDRSQSSLSRLHAPTASSLAKMGRRGSALASTTGITSRDNKSGTRISVEKKNTTLSSITNNPPSSEPTTIHGSKSLSISRKIFSKPLNPSCTPGSSILPDSSSSSSGPNTNIKPTLLRQRTLSGRKPRISRSKVISRLASQRANSVKNEGPAESGIRRSSATGKPLSAGRARSSLSAKANKPVGRLSHTGVRVGSGNSDLLMSAKKRARQSEYYARRQSRAETTAAKQSST